MTQLCALLLDQTLNLDSMLMKFRLRNLAPFLSGQFLLPYKLQALVIFLLLRVSLFQPIFPSIPNLKRNFCPHFI